jgi:hypothetical protein
VLRCITRYTRFAGSAARSDELVPVGPAEKYDSPEGKPMTESSDQLMSVHGDFQPLARDLGNMSGALSEIATVWRRAHQCRPDLPLALPLQLEAATHQLARIADDVGQDPANGPDLALLMTEQMSALERDVAAARAMTCGADIPPVGDAGLWELVGAAMDTVAIRSRSSRRAWSSSWA